MVIQKNSVGIYSERKDQLNRLKEKYKVPLMVLLDQALRDFIAKEEKDGMIHFTEISKEEE